MEDLDILETRQWAVEQATDLVLAAYEGRTTYIQPNVYVDEVLEAATRLLGFLSADEDEDEDEDPEGEDFDGPEGDPLVSVTVDVYAEGVMVTIGGEE